MVAYNQALVVAYAKAIEAKLQRCGSAALMPDGQPRTVGVVMHVTEGKSGKKEFQQYLLADEQEEALKRRFKKVNDPLSFVVVTAKWMTGFNAPIEGVLYLDKPLKAANLFQTITRAQPSLEEPAHRAAQRLRPGRGLRRTGQSHRQGAGRSAAEDRRTRRDPCRRREPVVGKFVADLDPHRVPVRGHRQD